LEVQKSNQTADNIPFHLRPLGLMTTPTFTEKNILFRDVNCAALPASDFLFKHNRNFQRTMDRIQILLAFYNTKFKYVASKSEIHKLQDKY